MKHVSKIPVQEQNGAYRKYMYPLKDVESIGVDYFDPDEEL